MKHSVALLALLLIATSLVSVDSKLACSSSQFCEEKLRKGSECVDGFCSNPFVEGCFKTMLGDKDQEDLEDMQFPMEILTALNGRVCNSDDLKNKGNNSEADPGGRSAWRGNERGKAESPRAPARATASQISSGGGGGGVHVALV